MSKYRIVYRPLLSDEIGVIDSIKAAAEVLEAHFNECKNAPREIAIARTKLEEAVMWAVKGVTG